MKRILIIFIIVILGFCSANFAHAVYFTRIIPEVVEVGDKVTITGKDFGNSSNTGHFYFNNNWAIGADLQYWSDGTIIAKVPVETVPGRVFVRKYQWRENFGDEWVATYGPYFYLKPEITSSNLVFASAGDLLRIQGKYFTDITGKVIFNSEKEGEIFSWDDNLIEVTVPEGVQSGTITLKLFNKNENKYSIEADGPYLQLQSAISDDPLSYRQWYLESIGVHTAWDLSGVGDNEVVVAVVDSGVDLTHEDLSGKIWTNPNEILYNGIDDDGNGYVDDVNGWNFTENTGNMAINNEHGTLVAGIIAAEIDNQIGIAGIAKNTKIMPLVVSKKVEPYEHPEISISAVSEAVKYAADNGADIINLSLGGFEFDASYTEAYDEAIKYAYNKGATIVASAGNGDLVSGTGVNTYETKKSPLCNDNYKNMVIGVASLGIHNVKSTWSDYGRTCIDISAPGEDILTTMPLNTSVKYTNVDVSEDSSYASANGTSFSSAIVSGVLALLKSKYPNITNYELKDLLKANADNIDSVNPDHSGANLGAGKINAYKLLKAAYLAEEKEDPVFLKKCSINKINPLQPKITWSATDNIGVSGYWNYFSSNKNDDPRVKGAFYAVKDFTAPLIDESGVYYFLSSVEDAVENRSEIFSCPYTFGDVVVPEEEEPEESVEYDMNLTWRLRGQILIQVEDHGKAWYIYPKDLERHYLGKPNNAFWVMRFLGWGITNKDLERLPRAGSNDKGDAKLVERLKGYIMLQVEDNGEAWYVNPEDGKRYYLARPHDALEIMRNFGLGISNADLIKIPPN